MHLLQELKFIDIKAGKAGPITHVLIWNPHYAIRWHHANKTPGLMEGTYNALLDRAIEIGANDMIEEIAWLAPGASPGTPVPEEGAAFKK
jgi:hypothetical protein